ncbi:hypothetical protein SARC_03728 [Sphaeroforma arctica JP610]|uniref:Uncharacterized protein n=1 Tax=Sphaeroforma arctica JP610 TaxID=667725 RepID=A0A0L0G5E6_9EUKA|nr:hypothetical protein SARC_03728 [Sphaeroforma arctica JP610]KNC84041.1 hypothetical protein SARC_03728 [Sphaeroforma arctica JP610]|eukprot:XP_014157943.1 hypothetical protein SARC_03728 [Sphaeroforma arctica JP610]
MSKNILTSPQHMDITPIEEEQSNPMLTRSQKKDAAFGPLKNTAVIVAVDVIQYQPIDSEVYLNSHEKDGSPSEDATTTVFTDTHSKPKGKEKVVVSESPNVHQSSLDYETMDHPTTAKYSYESMDVQKKNKTTTCTGTTFY